jgi:biofilm protein TabA
MIVDCLSRADFHQLPPPFAAAFAFLRRADLLDLPLGRHEIDGERVFALVQEYAPKPAAQGRLEAHRRYWDVQYVAAGSERMGWRPAAGLVVDMPHDEAKDIAFFKGSASLVLIPTGYFAIFAPRDAHMPMLAPNDEETNFPLVRKVVVKVEWPA